MRDAFDFGVTGSGEGVTVGIVIAYDNPNAGEDLKEYRKEYGLNACEEGTEESSCFRKVNQEGEFGNYPEPNTEWAKESSLDIDMVSAMCPLCHILLVETDSNSTSNMYPAVEKAAELGADVITNSWATPEYSGETSSNHYFENEGTPAFFASGDSGYGVWYPAASPGVVAVGGTSLYKAENSRGWTESVWFGAGSGCSSYEEKPEWQEDTGCVNRTVADVSAVADPFTPVSVYDTYNAEGWLNFGGTSAATPLLAAYAARRNSAFREAGAQAFYEAGEDFELFDVLEGRNSLVGGPCDYLCEARIGYDGPTGWGTTGEPLPGPYALTKRATDVTEEGATLNGEVNPKGEATTYFFEYGLTESYGSETAEASAGEGTEPIDAAKGLSGLEEKTYHYRIVAENSSGTSYGADRTFSPGPWEIEPTPDVGDGTLRGVSCVDGSSVCTAVGSINGGTLLAERWTGSEWQLQSPADPPESAKYQRAFYGVSCASATECVAVGKYVYAKGGTVPLAERWDGSEWVVEPTPDPTDPEAGYSAVYLHDVSCTSPRFCMAVGYHQEGSGEAPWVPFAERWNGSEWIAETVPAPEAEESSGYFLTGVSCVSASACAASGKGGKLGTTVVFAERWDGGEWQLDELEPPEVKEAKLDGVSCVFPTACTAVGEYYNYPTPGDVPLVEDWDGSEWTQTTPEAPNFLEGVSCTAPGQCMAFGHQANEVNFAMHREGKAWEQQAIPNPGGYTYLRDISCTGRSAEACTAVGFNGGFPGDGNEPLIVGTTDKDHTTTLSGQPRLLPLGEGELGEFPTSLSIVADEDVILQGSSQVTCSTEGETQALVGEGDFDTSAEGKLSLTLHNCEEQEYETNCHTVGEEAGTVTMEDLPFRLTYLPDGSLGVLFLPNAGSDKFGIFKCVYGLAKYELEGSGVLGRIVEPGLSEASSTLTVQINALEGAQELSEDLEGTEYGLDLKVGSGEPQPASLSAQPRLTFSEGKGALIGQPMLKSPSGGFPEEVSVLGIQPVTLAIGESTVNCSTTEEGAALAGSGEFESSTEGVVDLTLHNCEEPVYESNCNQDVEDPGTVTLEELPFRLTYLPDGERGILLMPNASSGKFGVFKCLYGLVKYQLEGNGVLGRIVSPEPGDSSSVIRIDLISSEGEQEYTKTLDQMEYGLEGRVGSGGLKAATLDAQVLLEFAEGEGEIVE